MNHDQIMTKERRERKGDREEREKRGEYQRIQRQRSVGIHVGDRRRWRGGGGVAGRGSWG